MTWEASSRNSSADFFAFDDGVVELLELGRDAIAVEIAGSGLSVRRCAVPRDGQGRQRFGGQHRSVGQRQAESAHRVLLDVGFVMEAEMDLHAAGESERAEQA